MNSKMAQRMAAILEVCKEPKTVKEIVAATGMTNNHFFNIVQAMIAEECLAIENPLMKSQRRYMAVPGKEAPPCDDKRLWTKKQDEYLRTHYASTTVQHIAKHLGRTQRAIRERASLLGIRKNAIQSTTSGKRFKIRENIGFLVSFPTEQPKGGRKVMLGEAYHTVGSPRKLSAWHGYSCEVMA